MSPRVKGLILTVALVSIESCNVRYIGICLLIALLHLSKDGVDLERSFGAGSWYFFRVILQQFQFGLMVSVFSNSLFV